jgi:heat shock protein HslJ
MAKFQSSQLKFAVAIVFVACWFASIKVMAIGDDDPINPVTKSSFKDTHWVVSRFELNGKMRKTGETKDFVFVFSDSTFKIESFCNTITAHYTHSDENHFKFYNISSTEQDCEKAKMVKDSALLILLNEVTSYDYDHRKDFLYLLVGNTEVIRLKRTEGVVKFIQTSKSDTTKAPSHK